MPAAGKIEPTPGGRKRWEKHPEIYVQSHVELVVERYMQL